VIYRCKECNQVFTVRSDVIAYPNKTGHRAQANNNVFKIFVVICFARAFRSDSDSQEQYHLFLSNILHYLFLSVLFCLHSSYYESLFFKERLHLFWLVYADLCIKGCFQFLMDKGIKFIGVYRQLNRLSAVVTTAVYE
jgi:hypothetical protein